MYQVYALKYGERDTTACNFFFRETSHEPITLHFFVWLVLGGPHPVLVDAGCREEHTAARGLRGFVSPAALVERVGVKADQIPLVVVSHLHWDHWAGHSLFPRAEYLVQREEVAFWTGPVARYEAYRMVAEPPTLASLVTLNYAGRMRLASSAVIRWAAAFASITAVSKVSVQMNARCFTSNSRTVKPGVSPGLAFAKPVRTKRLFIRAPRSRQSMSVGSAVKGMGLRPTRGPVTSFS